MTLEWTLIVLLALLALFYLWRTVVWRERAEAWRTQALISDMAAANLVEAVRNGEGAAAVRAWEER